MSQNILGEAAFFLHSFFMGIIITLVYDGFLILRRLIRHSLFLISLEDGIFWMGCAVSVFYMLYEENNGILRWFAVLGAAMGMLVYKASISSILVNILSGIIQKVLGILFRILGIVLRPIGFLGKKVRCLFRFSGAKGKKAGKYVKNRLTRRLKVLKMILCKH